MSAMDKLDQLAIEVFNERSFSDLTNYQQQIVITLYKLDEV